MMKLRPSAPAITKIARRNFSKQSSYTLLGIDVRDDDHDHFCAIMLWGANKAEAGQRRAEIIRAVNAHAALVEAAQFARSVLVPICTELSESMAIEKLTAALALVESEGA